MDPIEVWSLKRPGFDLGVGPSYSHHQETCIGHDRLTGGVLAPPEGWSPEQFRYLCNIDMDAVDARDVAYIDSDCSYWLADRAPNQPIRMRRSKLTLEIGHAIFNDAKRAWEILFPII
jgi:hypothetical protein